MEDNEKFDPNQDYGNGGGGGGDLPMERGTYLLAVSYVHEIGSVGAKRKRRARVKLEALARLRKGKDGAIALDQSCAGDQMWQSIWLSKTAWGILKAYMTAMGYGEVWDPFDDDDVKKALVGRPFRASVEPKKNGQYTDLDIVPRYLLPHEKLTGAERKLIDEWVQAFEERSFDPNNGGDGDFADGDWSPDAYGGSGSSDGFNDDDIPF